MTQFSRNTQIDPIVTGNGADAGAGPGAGLPSHGGLDWPRRNPLVSVWNHRWIALVTMLVVVAAAVVQVVRAKPLYEARARLTVERTGPRVVANDPSDVSGQTQNYLNTQCEVLRSRKILSAVAENSHVVSLPTFEGQADMIDVILKQSVTAKVEPKNDIIAVSVKSPQRQDAALLANAIVEAYKSDLESQKKSSVKQVVEFYEREKRKSSEDLDKKRQKQLEFQKAASDFVVGMTGVASPLVDELGRYSAAFVDARLQRINAQAAYDVTKAMENDPAKIRQLLDGRAFKSENADLRRQMRDLQQRYATVGKTYLPNFPDVGAMQTAIHELEQELQAEDKKTFDAYLAELDARLITLKNNEVQLEALTNAAKSKVADQNLKSAEYAIIQSEVSSLEKYDAELGMRIRELTPLSDEALVNVNIIETARMQDAPQVEPDVQRSVFIGLVGGLLLGCALAFGRDLLDQRLRSAEEIKQVTGLTLLGVVPHIQDAKTLPERGKHLHVDPASDVAESYRTVRTAVYFGTPAGTAKTLLVTSPTPGEGKSTLASNLAIAMAQAGNRILLLDADFRKPTQQKIWELDRNVGLSNVLAGQIELEQGIQRTPVPGLDVLPCGPIPANPSEILNSQMFADVLDELSSRYDHVLLDSPPVMPVTDARILAANCDVTLLTLRAEKTARKAAVYARDVLRGVGGRLLGVVVNDVPRRKGLYGYYYSDAQLYRYGYGYGRKSSAAGEGAAPTASGNGASTSTTAKAS